MYHHGWAQSRGEFKEAQDHEAPTPRHRPLLSPVQCFLLWGKVAQIFHVFFHEAHVEDIDKCIRQQFSGETKSHEEVILIMMGHSLALP